ncbi:hypothetical protein O185_12245 [Photorhabdus temperata J3]|uniref:Uncharacterized protein n=1 Tax=Photorhabdus temperata J3 TaxID=1389415 RepID=U7R0A3_PHOTE|nr:hypothetical protein O185_12245 [Photorhabdus temperata J3]
MKNSLFRLRNLSTFLIMPEDIHEFRLVKNFIYSSGAVFPA